LFVSVEFNKVYHNTLIMAISTIAEIEHLHNVHSGSPHITNNYSMIFKQQLTVLLICFGY